jgi:hypothetical protein
MAEAFCVYYIVSASFILSICMAAGDWAFITESSQRAQDFDSGRVCFSGLIDWNAFMSFGSSRETYRPFGETLGISGKAVQDSFESRAEAERASGVATFRFWRPIES